MIEDNPDTRGIYKDVFEREGFHVLLAEDGAKGLSYAQAALPDVILMDLMLPKISGFDILKRLRAQEDTRRIPVMIFSARDVAADLKQGADLGVTEYSAKALNSPRQMVSRVRTLMARAKRLEPPPTAPGSLQAALKESILDASRLETTLGFADGFHCPQCRAEVVLEMMPDSTHLEGHWFVTHFICPVCHRTF